MRWKRRWVEKSKTQLFHPAWKSRQPRGIPTFPPLRRLRLYEQKQKPKTGHFTCYKKRTFSLATNTLFCAGELLSCLSATKLRKPADGVPARHYCVLQRPEP